MSHTLAPRHALLAVAVVAVWGSNFVVIRFGLDSFPPFLFAAMRFTLAALPLVFILPRPRVPWANLATYGLFIGAGQFGLLFLAMDGHIAPGLASLVIQIQVFFTIGLSILRSGERVRVFQIVAALLAATGIVVIGRHTDATTTPLGLVLVILAGLSWAVGNMAGREAKGVNMLAYVAWSALFSAPPLYVLAFTLEGHAALLHTLVVAPPAAWAALLWQTLGNTMFGYTCWTWLLSRYQAAAITPMALLVPVFGMGAATLVLAEPMPAWKLLAAALVMGGLALGQLYPRVEAKIRLFFFEKKNQKTSVN